MERRRRQAQPSDASPFDSVGSTLPVCRALESVSDACCARPSEIRCVVVRPVSGLRRSLGAEKALAEQLGLWSRCAPARRTPASAHTTPATPARMGRPPPA
jgi:hypothetical protein